MNPSSAMNVSELLRDLSSVEDAVRVRALAALAASGEPADADCAPQVGLILAEEFTARPQPRHTVVRDAVRLLRLTGPGATPVLIACVTEASRSTGGDDDGELLTDELQPVFDALADLLPHASAGIAQLLELLDDDYPDPFRVQLLVCMSKCTTAAREIVPALVELGRYQVTTSPLYDAVLFALHAIGPPAVAPLVEILSGAADDTHRCFAAIVLGDFSSPEYPATDDEELASASRSSIPALIAALASGSPELRLAATHALGRMGPPARDAVPALTDALHDRDHLQRHSTARALQLITGN